MPVGVDLAVCIFQYVLPSRGVRMQVLRTEMLLEGQRVSHPMDTQGAGGPERLLPMLGKAPHFVPLWCTSAGIDWKASALERCKPAPAGEHYGGRRQWMSIGTTLLFFCVFELVRNTLNTLKNILLKVFFICLFV